MDSFEIKFEKGMAGRESGSFKEQKDKEPIADHLSRYRKEMMKAAAKDARQVLEGRRDIAILFDQKTFRYRVSGDDLDALAVGALGNFRDVSDDFARELDVVYKVEFEGTLNKEHPNLKQVQ